jgi:hypothetical protein
MGDVKKTPSFLDWDPDKDQFYQYQKKVAQPVLVKQKFYSNRETEIDADYLDNREMYLDEITDLNREKDLTHIFAHNKRGYWEE